MVDSTTSRPGIPSPTDPTVADLIRRWVAASEGDHGAALAAVVAAVSEASGVEVALCVDGAEVAPDEAVLAVDAQPELLREAGPWLIGFVREALLVPVDRRRSGVHHTPPAVAATIVSMALAELGRSDSVTVADPAVGGGVFLLAAVGQLGGSRAERIASVTGCDIDPLAVAATEAALRLWAGGAPLTEGALRVADFLGPQPPAGPADLVVGNPPFLSQLKGTAVRDPAARDALRGRWPDVGGYVDDAAAFLLAALDAVVDGGIVALVQPSSFLSARDAAPVRARLGDVAALAAMWIDGERQFAAGVDTVAPVLRRGARQESVRRMVGAPGVEAPRGAMPSAESWASLVADVAGVPRIEPVLAAAGPTLDGVANLTAGFRDEFYGLRAAVHEDRAGPVRLITSGLIDPLESHWGRRAARYDRRRWTHPAVDLAAVEPAVRGWVEDRLVPKVLVATQTKVLEAIVDVDGTWLPSTPAVSVEPTGEGPTLWHLAAALTSPVAAALVARDAAGSALSADAMRVTAKRLAALPLPPAGPDWDAAAGAAAEMQARPRRDLLLRAARLGMAAYGMADHEELFEWWVSRLPAVQPG